MSSSKASKKAAAAAAAKSGGEPSAASDPIRALAYVLRGNKGPESRSARLQDPRMGDSRVDYFRGKDLFRALRASPEILDEYAPLITGAPTPTVPTAKDRDAQVHAIATQMMKSGYFVRADRVYKTPRPGRTKRVKFPKFLEPVPSASQAFARDGEGIYAWKYDRPMSWTFVCVSFAAAVAVVLMCLFPLSPIWFKKTILYACIGILSTFFVIFSARAMVFALVWIVAGRQFWVLPNISSDEIPLDEIFSPLWAFDDVDANGAVVGYVPLVNRLMGAGSVAAVLYALYWVAPENGSAIKSISKAHGSILDLFDLNDAPKSVAGAVFNATGNETATAGGNDDVNASFGVNATVIVGEDAIEDVDATVAGGGGGDASAAAGEAEAGGGGAGGTAVPSDASRAESKAEL